MRPGDPNFDHILPSAVDGRPDPLDELLTVDELAALLKLPKSWIYGYTRRRGVDRLPHIKIGKYLRFFESDVREFLRSRVRSSGA